MQSLQTRLGTGLLLSLIVCFTMLFFLVTMNAEYLAEEYIASRIKHDADTLLSAINVDKSNKLEVDTTRIDLVYNQPFSGHYYVIETKQEAIYSRSLWDQTLNSKHIEAGDTVRSIQQGPEQQWLLVISSGYKKHGHKLTITIAEDLEPIKENINQFQHWFTIIAFGMLLILVVLQVLILRSSLKPLSKIQDELKSLEQGQLDKLSTDSPTELKPLINEVNHLLAVVDQRLRRSRDASSDLAHAIKKPLTVIQQITENSNITDEIKMTLLDQTNDIYQLTDRILKRARLAGHTHSGALFSFTDDLPALIKTLNMMYASKEILFTSNIQNNMSCLIDREDMLELLGNLLDNAYKWCAKKVVLSVSIDSALFIVVEDDGPGADPVEITQLAKRGVRLDEKVEGHGFGLAIAADIVKDYNGEIHFSLSNDLGGFRADVTLSYS